MERLRMMGREGERCGRESEEADGLVRFGYAHWLTSTLETYVVYESLGG
jgi:hypothetical protein